MSYNWQEDEVDYTRGLILGLVNDVLAGHISPDVAAFGFGNLVGAAPNDPEKLMATLVQQVTAAPDPFAEGSKWLTLITNAITAAIKEGERNGTD